MCTFLLNYFKAGKKKHLKIAEMQQIICTKVPASDAKQPLLNRDRLFREHQLRYWTWNQTQPSPICAITLTDPLRPLHLPASWPVAKHYSATFVSSFQCVQCVPAARVVKDERNLLSKGGKKAERKQELGRRG